MKVVNGLSIKNMPWEEKPEGYTKPFWRYTKNPVINRDPSENLSRVFNSSVVPYGDGFIGVFRGEQNDGIPFLYVGRSKDGLHFEFDKEPIKFYNEKGELQISGYQYDPRLVLIDDKYYITWCDDYHGPVIAIAYTKDFVNFIKVDHPFIPCNRNGVLFPRKINDLYYMLSRPSDMSHTDFGDVFISESPDLKYWGNHRIVMERGNEWWCAQKIGPGSTPIEIEEGWLMLFHGVIRTCSGFIYSIGGAILDKNDPSKVLYRCKDFLLTPKEDYETKGFVDNVIFPVSTLVDKDTGRLALYYGSADTYTCLAFSTIDTLVDYIKKHAR